MSDRSRRARADWTLYEAAGRDLEARADALNLEREDLEAQIEPLQLAVEGGVVEYKRSLASEAFRGIEAARYRSLTGKEIVGLAREFAVFAYVATLQRLMADGTIVLRERRRGSASVQQPDDEPDVKEIVAEIRRRVNDEPELKRRQPVKNILMQVSRYSREIEQFKELTNRTPADKRNPIAKNFSRTAEEIFASIRRNYQELQREERASVPAEPQNILLRIPIHKAAGVFLRQSRLAMDVRSGLLYAREEQYGTRELLLELAERHEPLLELIDEEERQYRELAGTERLGIQAARTFARELERRLELETEVY